MNITFVHKGREDLGIEYLSAILKQAGHKVNLACDLGLFGVVDNVFYVPKLEKLFAPKEKIIEDIKKSNPDIVAFTVYTNTYPWALEIARQVKNVLKLPTVFGGIHTTLVPEIVIKDPSVDFAVIGEGEYPMLELIKALDNKQTEFSIDNVWYKKQGQIIKNKVRPPLESLDSLPLPDKSIFEKYINHKDDYLCLTNRGCICSCSFCCENYMNRLYKGFHRRRSVDQVLKELIEMKKRYKFRAMRFIDSIFFSDKAWLRKLIERYKEEINVPFRCFGHIHFFDEEVAQLLKSGGCYAIEFGLQTFNESIRKTVLNCLGTNEKAKKAFEICDRFKIRYDIDHMFGLPQESEDDHKSAAIFYSNLKYLNRIKCHNLTYFPKLKIVDIAENEGMINAEDMENINNGEIGNFLNIESVKDKEILKINSTFKNFFKMYPVIPKWKINLLLKTGLYKLSYYAPSPIVVILQIIGAIKTMDYRYFVYLKQYPVWIIRSIFRG